MPIEVRQSILDPFTRLKQIRAGGFENETDDLLAYIDHVIKESASFLMIDLEIEEIALLREILFEIATDKGAVKPLGAGEAMVDLLLSARVRLEESKAGAALLYKRAGDTGLLAAGGIGYIPKMMRGRGAREKQAALEAKIKEFVRTKTNSRRVFSGGYSPRSYYQAASAFAYSQAATLGAGVELENFNGPRGDLITDTAKISAYLRQLEAQVDMTKKKQLLELIAQRVPVLSDLLYFIKTLCMDGDMLLATQIAEENQRNTQVLVKKTALVSEDLN